MPAVALLVGLAAGFFAGRSGPGARPGVPERRETPAGSVAPRSASNETELRRRSVEQDQEIRRLKEKIAKSGAASSVKAAPADRRARAREIHGLFKAARGEFGQMLRAWATLDEVDESMASTLIELYEPNDGNSLMLVMLAGGPEAAAFVLRKLNDPALPAQERQAILSNISGIHGQWIVRKLPYDAPVARLAETLLASNTPLDRAAAAGLLGGNDSDDSRARLRALADTDADMTVRAAAISSLGWIGDRTALVYLQSYPRDPNHWAVNQAVDRALEQLKERFPE